jgi:tetratricopeptide (TPR) repeat protein
MASRVRAAGILAGLFLLIVPKLSAGDVEVRQIGNFVIEMSGGSDDSAWHLQYGTNLALSKFKTLPGPGSTAYFSHNHWLRRVDTDKGVVTGRWIFPGQAITNLRWNNNHLEVEVAMDPGLNPRVLRTFDFDPVNPQPPPANQRISDTARAEGLRTYERRILRAAEAEKILPELQNGIRRDPFSPWLRIGLAHAYAVLGKTADSAQMINEGIRTPSAHFIELLEISNYLEEKNERGAARLAFERGYAEFWRQGQDPRLTSFLLFPDPNIRLNTPAPNHGELLERAYLTSPWVDGASRAWEVYGNALAANGDVQAGMRWQARASDAAGNGLLVTGSDYYFESLAAALVSRASMTAAVLYILILYFRYRPQRKSRLAAELAAGVTRPGFCNVEYWRRSEKIAFLSIVAVAWLAEGVASTSLRASSNRSFGYFFELRSGSLFSSNTVDVLQSRGASTPERDLVMAMAYDHDGQSDQAKELYERVPQFAESWNNLGVLLKNSGENEGSRRAFERALQLRPDFPEAEWNLGRAARGDWVKFHARYRPDKPMLAVPTRAQVLKAFGLREDYWNWTEILKGPLEKGELASNGNAARWRMQEGLLIFLAAGALVVPFFRAREVLVAPPRYQRVLELLFPGTSRFWGVFGGLVLCAACYTSSALWPPVWTRLYSYMNYSGSFRRFPLPPGIVGGSMAEFFSPIPSYRWFLALMALNAVLVLFWNWRRKSPIILKSAAPSSSG